MIVSAVQYSTEDVKDIREKALTLIKQAMKEKPDFILLQELFNTIYFPQYEDKRYFELAETIPGRTTLAIQKLIEGTDVTVVAPIFEKDGGSYYCAACVIDAKEGHLGTYRKLHIPTVPAIHETYYFQPGDLGHRVFETRSANIGIMLCYDRHFPVSARLYGKSLVDILFVASATPKSAAGPWFFEQQAHAFSNCFALVCSNRSGIEDKIQFLGSSFMCDHKGKMLETAEEKEDQIISCEIDIGVIRKAKKELVFYRDRRPDLYGAIVKGN